MNLRMHLVYIRMRKDFKHENGKGKFWEKEESRKYRFLFKKCIILKTYV